MESIRCLLRACHAARSGMLLGVALAISTESHAIRAQDTASILVRVEDRTRVGPRDRVVARDPRTGADREVYRSEGLIPFEATVSPDARYASFLEVVRPVGHPKRRLVVIELVSGQTVRVLGESATHAPRGIREYTWCCDADQLVVIVGPVGEPGFPGESTTLAAGVLVIDVRTGSEVRIEGVWRPQQVHWAAFDSSLYIKGAPQVAPGTRGPVAWPVYRYHVPSGRLSLTTHRGVFFSPDGKYYFDTGVYEASGRFQLYRTADDQEVTAQLAIAHHHLGPEGGWLPGAEHALVFIEKPAPRKAEPPHRGDTARLMDRRAPQLYPDRWNLAVDAENGRVIERFQGDLKIGWRTNAPALPVERRAGVELLRPQRP